MQGQEQVSPTKMVAAPAPTGKTVKIRALHSIYVGGKDIAVGEEIEVDETVAKEFCRPLTQGYAFDGERSNQSSERHVVKRAEIVK